MDTSTDTRPPHSTPRKPSSSATRARHSPDRVETVGVARGDGEVRAARRASDGATVEPDDGGVEAAGEIVGEQRLRLESHDTRAGTRQRPAPAADMGTDVEGEVAGPHELAQEPIEPPASPGLSVVDDDRAPETEGLCVDAEALQEGKPHAGLRRRVRMSTAKDQVRRPSATIAAPCDNPVGIGGRSATHRSAICSTHTVFRRIEGASGRRRRGSRAPQARRRSASGRSRRRRSPPGRR